MSGENSGFTRCRTNRRSPAGSRTTKVSLIRPWPSGASVAPAAMGNRGSTWASIEGKSDGTARLAKDDLAGSFDADGPVAVRAVEALHLAHPRRIGVVVHHLFGLAPRLGPLVGRHQRVDQDRRALGRVGAVGEATVAVARQRHGGVARCPPPPRAVTLASAGGAAAVGTLPAGVAEGAAPAEGAAGGSTN